MVKELTVSGYEAYTAAIAENAGAGRVVVAFYADADESSVSWCPDCRNCDPTLRKIVAKLPADAVFILCYVGDRPTWKDPNNIFRKELKLSSVPTFIKIGSDKRLMDSDCADEKLVEELFLN